jgi:hypothetical protein
LYNTGVPTEPHSEGASTVFSRKSIVVHYSGNGAAYHTPMQRFPLLRLALRSMRLCWRKDEDYCPTAAELRLTPGDLTS